MSAFAITYNGVTVGYVEADTRRDARTFARGGIDAEPISVAKVVALVQDGKAITDVRTGQPVGGTGAEA